jgi:hypothetical protein
MRFEIEVIDLPRLYDESPAFDIQPIHNSEKSEWMVLKGSGELVIVDFGDHSIRSVGRVDDWRLIERKRLCCECRTMDALRQ